MNNIARIGLVDQTSELKNVNIDSMPQLFGADEGYCLLWDFGELDGKQRGPGFYRWSMVKAAQDKEPAVYDWKWIGTPWRVQYNAWDATDRIQYYYVEIRADKGPSRNIRVPADFWDGADGWKPLTRAGVRFAPGFSAKHRGALFHAMVTSKNKHVCNRQTKIIPVAPGWQNDEYKTYIFPDGEIIGNNRDDYVIEGKQWWSIPFSVSGTAAEWKSRVAPLLDFRMGHVALCVAFAAPFVRTKDNIAAIEIYGDSNSGKTLLGAAAVSVYGNAGEGGNCAVIKARATQNSLEKTVARFKNCVLVVDELAQLSRANFDNLAYMLGNGRTKGRCNQSGDLIDQLPINTLCLMTGERSMMDFASRHNLAWDTGQARRILSVPFDASLPKGVTASNWKRDLDAAITDCYGVVGRQWITMMIGKLANTPDYLDRIYQDEMPKWRERFPGVTGQAEKIMQGLARICALGCGAFPVHGINEDAIRKSMFAIFDTLREEFGSGNRNVKMAVTHLQQKLEAAVQDLSIQEAVGSHGKDGYYFKGEDETGLFIEYVLPKDVFERSGSQYRWDGNAPKAILEWLLAEGVVLRNEKQKNRWTWNRGGKQCYRFRFPRYIDAEE